MRRSLARNFVTVITGVVAGGFLVFLGLAWLGRSSGEIPAEASPADTLAASATPTLSSPSPTSTPSPATPMPSGETRAEALRVAFKLPSGYHVATSLNVFEAAAGASKRFSITRASDEQEQQYVALVKGLREQAAGTEVPSFTPGNTITLELLEHAEGEQSDATLSNAREPVVTPSGLQGTRYRRVQGIETYDSVYLALPGGGSILMIMSYDGDGNFDEAAYTEVLKTLRPL